MSKLTRRMDGLGCLSEKVIIRTIMSKMFRKISFYKLRIASKLHTRLILFTPKLRQFTFCEKLFPLYCYHYMEEMNVYTATCDVNSVRRLTSYWYF